MGYQLPIAPNSITIAGHSVALGGSQNLAASDLTNGTTGTGDVVLANSPGLTTPNIGAASAASITTTAMVVGSPTGGMPGSGINLGGSGLLVNANTVIDSGGNGSFAHLTLSGSSSWTANGTGSVSLTSLAPSGAHATVQEWLTIVDNNGVTRYLPCF